MGKVPAAAWLSLTLVLLLLACVQADQRRPFFDIAAQPVAAALNEFARQADVTLIFSYDSVSGMHSPPLQGRYLVDEGLIRLLRGTPLTYRRVGDGSYLVCLPVECSLRGGSLPPQ